MDTLFQALKLAVASLAALLLGASAAALWGWPIALAVIASVILISLLAPGSTPRIDGLAKMLGLGLVVGVALQSLAWAYLFDSQQSSDFGVYYRCGLDLKPTLAENLESCQSAYIAYGDLYWRRSLLSTVPVGLAGGGYGELKIFNAILQGLAGLVVWAAAMRWLGPLAALATIAVFAAYPDRSFALTLATSDHAATLLAALGIGCLAALSKDSGRARLAVTATAAGALAMALALTRSTGIFLLAAAVLVLALQVLPRDGLGTAVLGLVVLVVAALGGQAVASSALSPSGSGDSFLRLASSLDINPTGDFSRSAAWIHHFWPAIPAEVRTPMALLRLGQEVLSDGAHYPAYLLSKAQTLTSGVGYAWFAAADLAANRDTVRTVVAANVPSLLGAGVNLARICTIPILALLLAGALRAGRTALCIAALGFFGAAAGVMLFMGEVQPRYLLIVLPAAAFLAGAAFAPLGPVSVSYRVRELARGAGVLAVLIAGGVCVWATSRSLTGGRPLLQPVHYGSPDCPTRAEQVEVDSQQVVVRLKPGETCAEVVFALTHEGNELTFFSSDGQFPYKFETPPSTHVRYRVAIGQASIEGEATPGRVRWQHLPLPDVGAARVSMSVHRPRELAATAAQHVFAYPVVWQVN